MLQPNVWMMMEDPMPSGMVLESRDPELTAGDIQTCEETWRRKINDGDLDQVRVEEDYAWGFVKKNPFIAVELLHRATESHPNSAHAWFGLAAVYENLGRIPEREAGFQRALQLDPTNR